MLEQQIQKKILDYLKHEGWFFKAITCNKNGVPDIIGVIEGRLIALEVKRLGNKPTKIQQYQIEQIQKAGGLAAVVTSVEDVKKVIDNV